MNDSTVNLISKSLELNTDAVGYSVSRRLAELYPDQAVVEGGDPSFKLLEYAAGGQCTATPRPGIHPQITTGWMGPQQGVGRAATNAWFDVAWRGETIQVLLLTLSSQFQVKQLFWIIARDQAIGDEFLMTVCEWCSETRGEIVVFEGGCWHKSRELFESVQGATFDNLILKGALKQDIQNDFSQFFTSRDEYDRYGIPWKRGVLFHGPPGNGKTHALKALVNWLNQPCLYIKSFEPDRFQSPHDTIRSVFHRARQTTPCLLVLEDLDSLIDDGNRSYFLNELDGFASNTGIVVLATTNHPERLDPAILNRPSRFDRKYAFGLPEPEERRAYLMLWNDRVQPELRLPDVALDAIVGQTEEFSFAYLKELWLSSLMRWVGGPKTDKMDVVMTAQIDTLREQMATPMPDLPPSADMSEQQRTMMQMFTQMSRR
jgi:hypothetical protein